jgi:hypothetical protein
VRSFHAGVSRTRLCPAFLAGSSHDSVTPFDGSGLPASSVHALTSRRRRNQLSRLRRFNRAWGYGFREAMCSWHNNDNLYNLPPNLPFRPPPGIDPYYHQLGACTTLSAASCIPALALTHLSQPPDTPKCSMSDTEPELFFCEDNQPPGTSNTPNGHDLFTTVTQFVPLHSAKDVSSYYCLKTPIDHIVDLRADADLLPHSLTLTTLPCLHDIVCNEARSSEYSLVNPLGHLVDLRADADLLPLPLPPTTQFCLYDVERDAEDISDGEFDTVCRRG